MELTLLGQGSRPLIGVDVSASAVKMLELSETAKGGRRVERYAIVPLPKDAVVDGSIAKPDLVEAAVRDAWRKLGSKTRNVAMALPKAAVQAKTILIPSGATDNDVEIQVEAEANQIASSASIPLDGFSLDYQVLDANAKNPDENDALVVVTRKESVEERVAIIEAAGLTPVIMDVDMYATLSAFEQLAFQLENEGDGLTVAVVDIGAQNTHFNVIRNGRPVHQSTHAMGGATLTSDIARRFDMTAEAAEEAKRKGMLPESYESEVLLPFLDSIAQEISRALQMLYAATPYQQVDHILLTGGCAAIPGLDDVVSNKTQISTMIANPFAKMAVSPNVKSQQLAADAPALFVACGLALRKFDTV